MNKHLKIILVTLVLSALLYMRVTWRIFVTAGCGTLFIEAMMLVFRCIRKEPEISEDDDIYSELK